MTETGKAYELHAGPISVTFIDGELRHIKVGDRQIIQRVYFAVRDSNWDTAMPELSQLAVSSSKDAFTVTFQARSTNSVADYSWNARIEGTPAGRLSFTATGSPNRIFSSPRVGINVLFGTPELSGHKYEITDTSGVIQQARFPFNVHPDLITKDFSALTYTTETGMTVTTRLHGAYFWMEDQRQYGDASYKALGWHEYQYPNLKAGDEKSATLTIEVTGKVDAAVHVPAKTSVTVTGDEVGVMPRLSLTSTKESSVAAAFVTVLAKGEANAGRRSISWAYCPVLHLKDDDTFIDNLPTVVDQARTMRAIAKDAEISIDPVTIISPYPHTEPDIRSSNLFGASWFTGLVKYLAAARVHDVTVALRSVYIGEVLRILQPLEGYSTLNVIVQCRHNQHIEAFAIKQGTLVTLCIANLFDHNVDDVDICGLDPKSITMVPRIGQRISHARSNAFTTGRIHLKPHEICFIQGKML